MKTYSLEDLIDKYIGKIGTKKETNLKINYALIY